MFVGVCVCEWCDIDKKKSDFALSIDGVPPFCTFPDGCVGVCAVCVCVCVCE